MSVDATEFLTLLDANKLEAALELYQGPFLDGSSFTKVGNRTRRMGLQNQRVSSCQSKTSLFELGRERGAGWKF